MEHKLTHDDTLGLQDVVKIGDLLLLPEQAPLPHEEARALLVAGLIKPDESSVYKGVYELIQLQQEYDSARTSGHLEPEWIENMPMSVRTFLRLSYALTQEDALAIVPGFRYAGLSYMVLEGGLCEDLHRAFNLGRLQHIKQLGFLNQPTYNQYDHFRQSLSESDRWLHSLDTMAIATVIGNNLGFSEEQLNEQRTIALTHDAATPAGGDSIKLVAPLELDEDINYELVLDRIDFDTLQKKYGLDRERLLKGIRNQGLQGEILDIADKLAYVARDLDKCMHHIEAGAHEDQLGLQTLLVLLERFPYVCSIWDDVAAQDGHAVFTNVRRLVAFLKVRLLMFRELYYHPTARFGEFLMSSLLVKVLYQQGKLTRDQLLEMNDGELLLLLDKEFGTKAILDTCSSDLSRCKTFPRIEEAQTFMDELHRSGNVFAMLDDHRRMIKTGTRLFFATRDGPRTLVEIDPGSAQELEEMAASQPSVHVYYLDGDPALSRKTLADLKRQLGKSK